MISRIISTFLSRLSVAGASFLLVVLTSRYLGAEGRGEISMITLSIALIMLGNDFLSGSSLVYYVSRKPLKSLLLPSYSLGLVICLIAFPFFSYSGFLNKNLIFPVCLLALGYCIISTNNSILLGKKMIQKRNVLQSMIPLLHLVILWGIFKLSDTAKLDFYLQALFYALAGALILSFIFVSRTGINWENSSPSYSPEHIRAGLISQTGNIIIFLAYRFNFWIIQSVFGNEQLGIYSTALMLGEALLMISQSFAIVQHAHTVNSDDPEYRTTLAVKNFRLVLMILVMVALITTLLPDSLYSWVFGKDFSLMRPVLLWILPGIVFLGLSSVFSHYYAGIARFRTMLAANSFCLLSVVLSSVFLVRQYGIEGAAIAQSAGYLVVLSFYLFLFLKEHKMSFTQLLIPGRET